MSDPLNLEYLYFFSDPESCVIEAKINGLEAGAPPDKVFHWLQYDWGTQRLEKLCFKSMGSEGGRQFRLFAQGELRFDAARADLRLESEAGVEERRLEVNEPDSVPPALQESIQAFLANLIRMA